MDLGDFVQLAGGAGALIAAAGFTYRQVAESLVALAKARAAKVAAEAAQDAAGAKAFEDALERVDRLETRVAELEGALENEQVQRGDERRHFEGQISVLGQQLDRERRARGEAEEREYALAREMAELRLAITGSTQLPTPMRPPPPKG